MSRILAIIQKMRDLGLDEASILAVVEVAEAAPAKTSAAERQARYRARQAEKNASHRNERDVTRDVTNVTPEDVSRVRVLCGEEFSIKNKITNVILQKEPKKSANRGTRITGCWSPEPQDWHFAIAELGGEGADRELAKFRDYWIGKPGAAGLKLDWSATWRNWVRKAADDRKARAGPNSPQKKPGSVFAQLSKNYREGQSNEPYNESSSILIDAKPSARGFG